MTLQVVENELAQKSLEDGTAYDLIRILAMAGYTRAEPIVSRFLASERPDLRQITLRTLVFWWGIGSRYEEACREILLKDEDDGVRTTAASCLGGIYEGRQDRSIIKLLAYILRNPVNDKILRDAAYSAILEVIGYPPKALPSATKDLDYKTEVDWRLVDQWAQ